VVLKANLCYPEIKVKTVVEKVTIHNEVIAVKAPVQTTIFHIG